MMTATTALVAELTPSLATRRKPCDRPSPNAVVFTVMFVPVPPGRLVNVPGLAAFDTCHCKVGKAGAVAES